MSETDQVPDPLAALRQPDRALRNAVNAVWDASAAEITALRNRIAELEAKLTASYDAWDRLYAVASNVDFDASESAVPETQERWIDFVREIQDALERLAHPMDADPAAGPDYHHVPDEIRDIAIKIGHAAAESAVRAMALAEVCIWMNDLGLANGDESDWTTAKRVHALLANASAITTLPALYLGTGDPGSD